MAEATSATHDLENDAAKSDPLVLLLSGGAALLWGLMVYGLLVKVPEYASGFLGREEQVPVTARWLVAMSEPWIVLLLTLGIFALILGSFHYRNKPLGMIMVMMGAVSVWWSLSTLEEAKVIAQNAVGHSGPPSMNLNALESKLGAQPYTPPQPPAAPKAPVTPVVPVPPATPQAVPEPKK